MLRRIILHLRARWHESMCDREEYNVRAAMRRRVAHYDAAMALRDKLEAMDG